jgi:hypothetical protein
MRYLEEIKKCLNNGDNVKYDSDNDMYFVNIREEKITMTTEFLDDVIKFHNTNIVEIVSGLYNAVTEIETDG